jgi:hypothetical protein
MVLLFLPYVYALWAAIPLCNVGIKKVGDFHDQGDNVKKE